jgi:hypothetical protein
MDEKQKAIRLKVTYQLQKGVDRVIDVLDTATLEDLHLTILAAFELTAGEMASFWLCGGQGYLREQEIPMIRMVDETTGETSASMRDVRTQDAIHDRRPYLVYEYDMLLMWVFHIEFVEWASVLHGMDYPLLVEEKGKMPNLELARASILSESSEGFINNEYYKDDNDDDDYRFEDLEGEYGNY